MFKLIRDKIPEIMAKDGVVCNYATAENAELYVALLRTKLIEEVNEYLEAGTLEELADIETVITAIAEATASKDEFVKVYGAKLKDRGGFEKRYIGFFPDKEPEQKA